MSSVAAFLLVAVMLLQVPVGLLVLFDAKRLDLKNPERYGFGVVVPTAGLLVALYYFSERKKLPRKEPTS